MATINETAAEVAGAVVDGIQNPTVQAEHLRTATTAALMMSDRLGKSIPADDYFERIIDFQSKAFSQAQSHNQIFIGIGYATLTAVWSATASNIPVPAMLLSGACLLFSAAIFVGWTILGMLVTQVCLFRLRDVYAAGPVNFIPRNAEVEAQNQQTLNRVQRWWKPIVAAAGIPALIAAATLVWASGGAIVTKAIEVHRQPTHPASSSPNAEARQPGVQPSQMPTSR